MPAQCADAVGAVGVGPWKSRPGMLLMSTNVAGLANRSFIIGIRL